VQRRRLQQSGFRGLLALADAAPLGLLAQPEVDDPNDRHGQGIEDQHRIEVHVLKALLRRFVMAAAGNPKARGRRAQVS
jgi:hypothetical protein